MNDDTQTANSPDEAQDITILAPVPVITEENGEHVLRYTVGERTYTVRGGAVKVHLRELALAAPNWPFRLGDDVDDVIASGLLNRAEGSSITMQPQEISAEDTQITLTETLEGAENDGRMTTLDIVVRSGSGGDTMPSIPVFDDLTEGLIGTSAEWFQTTRVAWPNASDWPYRERLYGNGKEIPPDSHENPANVGDTFAFDIGEYLPVLLDRHRAAENGTWTNANAAHASSSPSVETDADWAWNKVVNIVDEIWNKTDKKRFDAGILTLDGDQRYSEAPPQFMYVEGYNPSSTEEHPKDGSPFLSGDEKAALIADRVAGVPCAGWSSNRGGHYKSTVLLDGSIGMTLALVYEHALRRSSLSEHHAWARDGLERLVPVIEAHEYARRKQWVEDASGTKQEAGATWQFRNPYSNHQPEYEHNDPSLGAATKNTDKDANGQTNVYGNTVGVNHAEFMTAAMAIYNACVAVPNPTFAQAIADYETWFKAQLCRPRPDAQVGAVDNEFPRWLYQYEADQQNNRGEDVNHAMYVARARYQKDRLGVGDSQITAALTKKYREKLPLGGGRVHYRVTWYDKTVVNRHPSFDFERIPNSSARALKPNNFEAAGTCSVLVMGGGGDPKLPNFLRGLVGYHFLAAKENNAPTIAKGNYYDALVTAAFLSAKEGTMDPMLGTDRDPKPPLEADPRAATFASVAGLNGDQERALGIFYAAGTAQGWLDKLYFLFVANAPNENAAKIDLVAPVKDGSPNALTTRNGQSAVPWFAGQGFKLDNTLDPKPGYNLPFNPKTEALRDDFGLILGLSSINGNRTPDVRDSLYRNLLAISGDITRTRLQSDSFAVWTINDGLSSSNSPGIYTVQRAAGGQSIEAYRFGTQLDSKTVASIEPNQYGDEIVLGAARSQDQVSGRTVTVVGTTRRLTAQQVSQLTAALNALMNSWSL